MLSRELEVSLNLAFKDARAKRHEMMTVEHLALVAVGQYRGGHRLEGLQR